MEKAKRFFDVFWQEEEEPFIASWARWEAQSKDSVELERRCQDKSQETHMLSKRQEIFKNAIESWLRVQSRASEILQELVRFGPSIPVETVKACASIGLHMMIEENSRRSEIGSSFSSSSSSENNVGIDALFVIGLHGSGDTIAVFLQHWEVAKVAWSCQESLDMLCQELHEVERRRGRFGF